MRFKSWMLLCSMSWVIGGVSCALEATGQIPDTTAVGQKVEEQSKKLKVVCWNVLYGFNHGKSVEAGARWLAAQQPDVAAFQELNGMTSESLAKLARNWRHTHAVILKETGFPVGLTSRFPIQTIEKRVKGFHHGYLHCKIGHNHFFVVHFWPGKEHESEVIASKVEMILKSGQQVVVLGDFNSHSPYDRDFLETRSAVKPSYQVIKRFEKLGLVDLVRKHSPESKYSCPSPITIPKWSKDQAELKTKRQRIDFVLASPGLAERSRAGTIVVNPQVEAVSDHYPLVVELGIPPSSTDD